MMPSTGCFAVRLFREVIVNFFLNEIYCHLILYKIYCQRPEEPNGETIRRWHSFKNVLLILILASSVQAPSNLLCGLRKKHLLYLLLN